MDARPSAKGAEQERWPGTVRPGSSGDDLEVRLHDTRAGMLRSIGYWWWAYRMGNHRMRSSITGCRAVLSALREETWNEGQMDSVACTCSRGTVWGRICSLGWRS